ncbi:hypothetical protein AB0C38_06180 [Amycolatopsis sp. NPDC048633]|uniref:hypothetical protein n=1 Tax=Amycolatopsis sp. NPDC048633 TaxID=3157095 RepID=UPI0033C8EC14
MTPADDHEVTEGFEPGGAIAVEVTLGQRPVVHLVVRAVVRPDDRPVPLDHPVGRRERSSTDG